MNKIKFSNSSLELNVFDIEGRPTKIFNWGESVAYAQKCEVCRGVDQSY